MRTAGLRLAVALAVVNCGGRAASGVSSSEADSGSREPTAPDPTPAAPPGLVWCGDLQCDSRTEWCCVVGFISDDGFVQTSARCAPTDACVDPRAAALQCDETADCPANTACCWTPDRRQSCMPECPADAARLCDLRVEGGGCGGRCYASGTTPGEVCVEE